MGEESGAITAPGKGRDLVFSFPIKTWGKERKERREREKGIGKLGFVMVSGKCREREEKRSETVERI